MPPPSDEGQLRRLLVDDVVNGGLWFADAACETQFGQPAKLEPAAFDAFARCVGGLHLRPTGRGDMFDDTSVLTPEIARALMSWAFRPYVVDGVAIPVCSAITFIYTQR